MNDSLKPKSSNKYRFDIKRPTTFYGLPSVVKFCKKCTYSNQKPISEKEFEHKVATKKTVLGLTIKEFVQPVSLLKKRKR